MSKSIQDLLNDVEADVIYLPVGDAHWTSRDWECLIVGPFNVPITACMKSKLRKTLIEMNAEGTCDCGSGLHAYILAPNGTMTDEPTWFCDACMPDAAKEEN
jgi:hypothetical protein